MVTRMNHAAHLMYPDTSLMTVITKEVLLSADARIRTVTVVLIRYDKRGAFSTGTLYTCFPRPSFTAIVDVIAGASTAS